jgi:hypothetical protein
MSSSVKIILSFIGFITLTVVSYFSYFYYAKNQGELVKLKSEHELLKKEKEGLENSKSDFLIQSKNTESKIKDLERENNKIKQDIAILEKRLAGSVSYKECEDKIESKLKTSIGITEENCNTKIEFALTKKDIEFGKQTKNLISQEDCNQKIESSIKKVKVDLEKDNQIKLQKLELELLKNLNTGTSAASIVNDIKNFFKTLRKDNKDYFEQQEKNLPLQTTKISSNFNSIDSSPHFLVDLKMTKLKKKVCLKNAEEKLIESDFKEIKTIGNGVWGIKNGYKSHIFCGNEGKIVIFSTVGENGGIVKTYVNQLKKDF